MQVFFYQCDESDLSSHSNDNDNRVPFTMLQQLRNPKLT